MFRILGSITPRMRLPILSLLVVLLAILQAGAAEIHPIDLKPYYNYSLTNSLIATGGLNGHNNLSAFPIGKGTYGGIPFDVSGVIQLTGNQAAIAKRTFPDKVEGIKIGAACARIHLLHGAGWNDLENAAIANLTLHYADGTTHTIPIVYGKHILDWWVNDDKPEDPGTQVGWTGVNRISKMFGTDLRIYRTTFPNAKPTVIIDSIDYVSGKKESASFLLGLTIQ
jgi:hypothetical protein